MSIRKKVYSWFLGFAHSFALIFALLFSMFSFSPTKYATTVILSRSIIAFQLYTHQLILNGIIAYIEFKLTC